MGAGIVSRDQRLTEEQMAEAEDYLTPNNAAMLLIDHQVGLLTCVRTMDPVNLKNNIIALAKLAKIFKLPVVLTTSGVSATPNGPLLPELVQMFPENEIIDRTLVNSWHDPVFVKAVEKTGRKKLIMAGISTDVCLAFPAISAVKAGYDVYGVIDASATWDPVTEHAAMMRMNNAGVKVVNWVAAAAELQRDWALPTAAEFGMHLGTAMGGYSLLAQYYYSRQ
jgi:nicotinamidase-related amidase